MHKRIDNNSIDLLLTDPPYGMNYVSNYRKEKYIKIEGDDNLNWLKDYVISLKRIMKADAHWYVFCSWHNIDIFKTEISKYFNIKNILIWKKNHHGAGDLLGDYAPAYEMIIFISSGIKKLNGERLQNVLNFKKTLNNYHPTEKPVDLLKLLILKSSNKDDLILDSFCGSGSTAVACSEVSRRFIGSEINTDYYNISKNRTNYVQREMFL